jgi:threonine synthase
MVLAVNRAVASGARAVIYASTSSTALGCAYAFAGLRCSVVLPAGNVARGKLASAGRGSRLLLVNGNFDQALAVRVLGDEGVVVVQLSPDRIAGQQPVPSRSWTARRRTDAVALRSGMRQHHRLLGRLRPLRGRTDR